jgi:hypothetical protein
MWPLRRTDLPVYREPPGGTGAAFPEVAKALSEGRPLVRISEQGELIVSVAVPIQRYRAVLGVLHAVDPGRRHRQDHRFRAQRDLSASSRSRPWSR